MRMRLKQTKEKLRISNIPKELLKDKIKGFHQGSRVAKIIEFSISNDIRFADQTRSTSNFLAKKKGRTLKAQESIWQGRDFIGALQITGGFWNDFSKQHLPLCLVPRGTTNSKRTTYECISFEGDVAFAIVLSPCFFVVDRHLVC